MPSTPNFDLPLLHAAQVQKEITHNEALTLIDALLAGAVVAVSNSPPTPLPQPGRAWIVGDTPTGAWTGQASRIAIFSVGGWRFAPPVSGLHLRDDAAGVLRRYDGNAWLAYPAIAEPAGGAVVDAEARAALGAVVSALRLAGFAALA